MSTEPTTPKQFTVRELQAILNDCDPDATVDLTLPGFIDASDMQIVEDPDLASDAYGFVPQVEVFYKTGKDMPYEHFFGDDGAPRPGVKPNAVSIAISRDEIEKLYRDRKRAIELDALRLEPEPATADADTVIVDVRLSRELHTNIRQLLGQLNGSRQVKIEQACTHGLLTVAGALAMLAETSAWFGAGPVPGKAQTWPRCSLRTATTIERRTNRLARAFTPAPQACLRGVLAAPLSVEGKKKPSNESRVFRATCHAAW